MSRREAHHIDVIPADERRGRPSMQFTLWLGANMNVFNLVLGGVLVSLGFPLGWAIAAIVVGTGIGALLIALHATQGPRLGVPQMIQSRAQFGVYGVSVVLVPVWVLCVGFIAAQLVIQSEALHLASSALSIPVWILLLVVPSVVIGIVGHDWIHRAAQLTAVVAGVTVVICVIAGLRSDLTVADAAAPTAGLFVAGCALFVIDMLSFGPFVSDYSRYLPDGHGARKLIGGVYAGAVTSTVLCGSAGAYLASLATGDGGALSAVGEVAGPWALVLLALSLVNANAYCAYTGGMQLLGLVTMVRAIPPSWRARMVPFGVTMLVGVVFALTGYDSFIVNLENFLNVLLALFIPWSAVNLTDFFLVRRGRYDVAALFDPDGRYGRWQAAGLTAYGIGVLAELPFVKQTWLTGPLVDDLGGADISWLVGFFVTAAIYAVLAPRMGAREASVS